MRLQRDTLFVSRFTCNNQSHSRFVTSFVILESQSVFCWVTLIHWVDCQGVDVLHCVLMIQKWTCSSTEIHSLVLIIKGYFKPEFRHDLFGVCRIFTGDVYWWTFQSTDSLLYIIYNQAVCVTCTWQMKIKRVSLLSNIETYPKSTFNL